MQNNIILLHGALGSKQQLAPLKNLLSSQFNVYDLNFDGHGGKASEQAFSIELFTDNVLAFLQMSKIEKTNIFGYSMGGYVALNLAKHHPNLVGRIVTLGTKFNWTKEAAAKEIKMLKPEIVEEKVPKFAKMLAELHRPNDWKVLMRNTATMMSDMADGKKLHSEDLRQLKHDILIGIGQLDKMVTIEESELAVNDLANGQLKIIDDFQHPIERVDANLLATIISDFILKGEIGSSKS